MNALLNIFLIFIFLCIILFLHVPNINNNNYILHKIIIFLMLFIYQCILILIFKIKNKCKIDFYDIFSYGIETGTIGIIGYSLFTDLQYYKFNGNDIFGYKNIYVALIITILLTFVCTIKLLFGYKPYDCIKYE